SMTGNLSNSQPFKQLAAHFVSQDQIKAQMAGCISHNRRPQDQYPICSKPNSQIGLCCTHLTGSGLQTFYTLQAPKSPCQVLVARPQGDFKGAMTGRNGEIFTLTLHNEQRIIFSSR